MRRARFLPFGLMRPSSNLMNNHDTDEDEFSSRSYNYMGDEDGGSFIDQIVSRANATNAFRNFDDYEALLNLDDNIVQAVP